MPVKSLTELATAACFRNIKSLESVGDYLPYENVRNILMKVETGYQLRQIELNSPQIQGYTGEIWLKLIERDFPLEFKSKGYKPQNPDKWYRVWEKYKTDHDRALQESEDKLKNALAGLRENKEKNTSKIVDQKFLPRPPGYGVVKRHHLGPRDNSTSTLTFGLGSRTKTSNGASVMRKVRREVKEIATIHGALSKPVKNASRLHQVHQAPAAMVNDYRRAAKPFYRTNASTVPEIPSAVTDHEKRASFISDSEEDDEEGYEMAPPKSTPSRPAKPSTAKAAATSLLKRRRPLLSSSTRTMAPTKTTPAASASPSTTRNDSSSAVYSSREVASSSRTTRRAESPPAVIKQAAPSPAKSHYPPRTRETSPPETRSSPPAEAEAPAAASAVAPPRKRKAVDIFMRRKKTFK